MPTTESRRCGLAHERPCARARRRRSRAAADRRRQHHQPGADARGRRRGGQRPRRHRGVPRPSARRRADGPADAGDGRRRGGRQIREIDPQARVIVLTTYDADEDIARALQAGAKAYILKDIAADALGRVHPRRPRRQDLSGAVGRGEARRARHAGAAHAARAVGAAAAGQRPQQQGNRLRRSTIAERTVKTHLGHLFEKLGVTSRTEAVRVATRRGLVRFD